MIVRILNAFAIVILTSSLAFGVSKYPMLDFVLIIINVILLLINAEINGK